MDHVVKRLAAIDLNLLVTFHVLLRFGGVTAAAQHLGLTQSTVSHQLARLRELLDDPILVRRGNRMEATPRAITLAPAVGEALSALHDAVLTPAAFDPSRAEGEVVLAMTDWSSTEYSPRLLDLFAREAPGLRLRVVHPLLDAEIDQLDWDVDLALVSTAAPLAPERCRPIVEERFVGVARPDHAFCAAPPSEDAFLAADKLVVHSAIAPSAIDAELEQRLSLASRGALRVPFFLAVPPLVRGRDLVALVPSNVAWGLVHHYGLGVFELPIALPSYHVSLAWSPLRAGDPQIAWLADRVVAFVEEELPRRRPHAHEAAIRGSKR